MIDLGHEASVVINVEQEGRSVSGYLANLLRRWSHELARAECKRCRRGDIPGKMRGRETYAHRAPEGRNGSMVWCFCRASENWKMLEALTQPEENWEASVR